MNGILTRAFSGAIYVAIIVCLIVFGGEFGFPALCSVFAVLGAIELQRLETVGANHGVIQYFDLLVVLLISLFPIITVLLSLELGLLFILIAVSVRFILQIYSHADNPADKLGDSLLGYVYVGLSLALASSLYIEFGAGTVLTMFLMIWLNDTGAYLVGCSIGRHRLFPRISPKKSWEGFFGGMVFAILAGIVSYELMPSYTVSLPVPGIIALGVLVSVAATWGDLIESMLKRAANVKDSGKIMPGHGGILDRIDSLLLVVPTIWILMIIFKYI